MFLCPKKNELFCHSCRISAWQWSLVHSCSKKPRAHQVHFVRMYPMGRDRAVGLQAVLQAVRVAGMQAVLEVAELADRVAGMQAVLEAADGGVEAVDGGVELADRVAGMQAVLEAADVQTVLEVVERLHHDHVSCDSYSTFMIPIKSRRNLVQQKGLYSLF